MAFVRPSCCFPLIRFHASWLSGACLFLLCGALASAQVQPTVRGAVRVKGQGAPEQRVEVVLLTADGRPRDRVFTDTLGNFQFANVGRGNYILVIDHPGFHRLEMAVEVAGLQASPTLTQRMFVLEPKGLRPVTDSGSAAPVSVDLLRLSKEAREAFEKGDRELARRNYAKATGHLDKVLELAPEFADGWNSRGVAALQQNQLKEAREFFEKAVGLNPQHGDALIGLGAALNREGNSQAALEPLTRGLAIVPRSYLGLFERCRAALNLGQFEAAAEDCDAARQNAEGVRPELMVLQGNVFLRLNRNPEAMREFQNYLKHDSASPTAEAVRDIVGRMRKAGIKPAA